MITITSRRIITTREEGEVIMRGRTIILEATEVAVDIEETEATIAEAAVGVKEALVTTNLDTTIRKSVSQTI